MEPALNSALEDQAAARIYRLGQTRPTRIVRLIAEDTVEQNVLKMQVRVWSLCSGLANYTVLVLAPYRTVPYCGAERAQDAGACVVPVQWTGVLALYTLYRTLCFSVM